MGEQRNLTEENVEELKKHLDRMQEDNPDLTYRFFNQMEEQSKQENQNRELEEIKAELQSYKDRLIVKDPFKWMRNWLEACARKENGIDIDVDKIMDWIFQQPMTGG